MGEFRMPSLGADMEAGTVLEWYVKPGDVVHHGDIVALVDTSKADIEVEIFDDGVIEELLVPVGERVPVGTPMALVRGLVEEAGEPIAAPAAPSTQAPSAAPATLAPPPAPSTQAPSAAPATLAPPPAPATPAHRIRVSPLARRVAADLHVDLAGVKGSGPGGAIVRADVERAVGTPTAGENGASLTAASMPAAEPVRPPLADRGAALRATMGALMARSKREVPHYYLRSEIELSEPLSRLREENRARPVAERVLPAAMLLRAVACAAAEVPEVNGFWIDGSHQRCDAVHLGVAIAQRGGGLIAPAIHGADRKSIEEIMSDLRDLVARARRGGLRASEMADPTITVTNLGDQGVDEVLGVIYPPQVALVGFGRIRERPWTEDGMVGARPVVVASLSADHRASTGGEGARFLAAVERHLRTPEEP